MDNEQRKVVHIHNFTRPNTGNYTCRAQAESGGPTIGEDTAKVVIESSRTQCPKTGEHLPARARPGSSNRVTVAIGVSISRRPQVSNPKPALNPTTIISATEYSGTKHLTSPGPPQSSTTSEVSQSYTQRKICNCIHIMSQNKSL